MLSNAASAPSVMTYAELDRSARAVAAYLQLRGAQNERVLLLLPTSAHYVSGFLGVLYAGAVAVPAYPPESQRRQHLQRLSALARDAQPRFVLTTTRELPRLRGLLELVPELQAAELVALDAEGVIDERLADQYQQQLLVPEDLAFLQYTSGSLAAPKGVMVSHGNLMANERAIGAGLAFGPDDVMVTWLPLFHDMGLIGGLLQPLHAGASVVLMSPLRFLERPLRWLEAISEYRGTVSGGPDFAYRLCAERAAQLVPGQYDLRSWRLAFCGSEPIRAGTLTTFAERLAGNGFAPSALFPCYGLAEATLYVSGAKPDAGMQLDADTALVSCGVTPPEHSIAIAQPDALELLPEGVPGEICVTGPSVAQGYFRNQVATDAAFAVIEGRRYLRTGDLGFQRDGQLYISGRLKDLVIVRGRNIVPQDIEDHLASQVSPLQLGRVAVFGVETDAGEAIGVAAELSRAAARSMRPELLCRAIAAAVHDCVEEPAWLVALLPQGALPRTSSGKLQRRACAEQLRSGELSALAIYRDRDLLASEAPAEAVAQAR